MNSYLRRGYVGKSNEEKINFLISCFILLTLNCFFHFKACGYFFTNEEMSLILNLLKMSSLLKMSLFYSCFSLILLMQQNA